MLLLKSLSRSSPLSSFSSFSFLSKPLLQTFKNTSSLHYHPSRSFGLYASTRLFSSEVNPTLHANNIEPSSPPPPINTVSSSPEPPKKIQREIGQIIQCNFKLNTYVRERNFAEAEKLFQHMLAKPELCPNVITYTTMINSYRKQGDLDRIDKMLEEMKEKNIKANDMTYCALIEAFGKKGRLDRMIAFYDEMKINNFKPDLKTFVIIHESLMKKNDAETQRRVLTEMKKVNVPPNDTCYNCLLQSYSNREEIEPMTNTFNEMKKLGLQPDETTFHCQIVAWHRVGGLDEIKNFFAKMKILYVRPLAASYNLYMDLLIKKQNDMQAVLDLYKDIKVRKSKPNVETFNIMIDILNKTNGKAEEFMPLVEDAGNKNYDIKMDAATYNALLDAFATRGRDDLMMQTFEQMRKIPRMKPNVQTFNTLISGFGKAGKIAKAMEMVDEMKLKSCKPNSQTYINLIQACADNQKHDLIESLLKEMRESYKIHPDATVYSLALETLGKFGQIKRASELMQKAKSEGLLTSTTLKAFWNSAKEDDVSEAGRSSFVTWRDKLNQSTEQLSDQEISDVLEVINKL